MAGLWVVCVLRAEGLGHLQSLAGKSVDWKRRRLPARPGLRVSACRSEREGLSSPLPPPAQARCLEGQGPSMVQSDPSSGCRTLPGPDTRGQSQGIRSPPALGQTSRTMDKS